MHLRYPRSGLACLLALGLTGCQSAPRPLDLSGYLSEWRAAPVRPPPTPGEAGPSSAGPARLTLEDGTRLAQLSNPQARVLRLEAGAAQAYGADAGSWADPVLDAQVRHAIDGGASPWFVAADLTFSVPLSGAPGRQREHALALASVAELEVLGYELQLWTEVQLAWLAWSAAVERERLLIAYVATLEPLAKLGEELAAAGELPLGERDVLPIEHTRSALDRDQAVLATERHRQALLRLMGLAPEAAVELVPTLAMEPPSDAPREWPHSHPHVKLAVAGWDVAVQATRLAEAAGRPDLRVGPSFELSGAKAMLGVALSLPIPSINANRAEIGRSRVLGAAARARAELAAQRLVAQRHLALARYEAGIDRLAKLGALETRVDAQLARVEALYQQGELDPLMLRHALRTSLETQLDRVDGALEAASAAVHLHALQRSWSPEERDAP